MLNFVAIRKGINTAPGTSVCAENQILNILFQLSVPKENNRIDPFDPLTLGIAIVRRCWAGPVLSTAVPVEPAFFSLMYERHFIFNPILVLVFYLGSTSMTTTTDSNRGSCTNPHFLVLTPYNYTVHKYVATLGFGLWHKKVLEERFHWWVQTLFPAFNRPL